MVLRKIAALFASAFVLPVVGADAQPNIPDLTGVWAHPFLGFESPVSGPGPVRNMSRLPSGQSNGAEMVGDYTNPILRPEAAAVVKKLGEISRSGRAFPEPDNQCLQNPVPYIFWNFQARIMQQKDKIIFVYQHDEDYRNVRLNQPHPAKVVPSVHGDSVGHYEGETLVIDTVGVKLGPFRSIDRFGTPYTEALHVVERYRLIDPQAAKEALERGGKEWGGLGARVDPNFRKGLQLEFTVEDPGVFTMPWKGIVTYAADSNTGWEERICAENVEHEYAFHAYSDPNAHIPTADRPDF